mgnify:CR=1 FL=1
MFHPQDLFHTSPYGRRSLRSEEGIRSDTYESRAYVAYYYRDSQARRRVHEFRVLWDPDTSQVYYAEPSHAYPLQVPSNANLYDVLERLHLQEAQIDLQWADLHVPLERNLFEMPVEHLPVIELRLYEAGVNSFPMQG